MFITFLIFSFTFSFFWVMNTWFFFCYVGHAISFYAFLFGCFVLSYSYVFVVNNKAVAAEKGKRPLIPENPVISLDDLLAEKIGAEAASRFRSTDQLGNQNSRNIRAEVSQGEFIYSRYFS